MSLEEILATIEELRQELQEMLAEKEFLDDAVMSKSRELDECLNKYLKYLAK